MAKSRQYSSIRKNSEARGWWRTPRAWRRLAGRAGIAAGVVAVAAVIILAFRAVGGREGGPSPENLMSREAPGFSLSTLDGRQVSLSDFRGEKNVLLFFNEGYGCAPCWQQAEALEGDLDAFSALDTEVFAIMVDAPDLLEQEASRWGITLPILVDSDTSVSQDYDALGGMHANKPNHTFVLVDKTGVVRWSEDYPSMQADNESVLQQIQALGS